MAARGVVGTLLVGLLTVLSGGLPAASEPARDVNTFTGPVAGRGGAYTGENGRIAYEEPRLGISVMTPGGPPQRLESGANTCPLWSPDGTRLAASNNFAELVLTSPDAFREKATVLAKNVGCPADWSPDGRLLLANSAGAAGIYIVNTDGTGARLLVPDQNTKAKFSPDGTKVAFSRGYETWVIGIDGTNARRIADGYFVDWAPDGASIIVDHFTMRIVNATDGTTVRDLGDGQALSLSPDGNLLAYTPAGPAYTLNVMRLDGTDVRQLSTNAGFGTWSPDSTKIVFNDPYRRGIDSPDIWVIGADGTGLTRLVQRERPLSFAAFSLTWGVKTGPLPTPAQEVRASIAGARVKGKPKVGKTLISTMPPHNFAYYSVERRTTWFAGKKDISKQATSYGNQLKVIKTLTGKVIKVRFRATWNGHTETRTVRVGKVR